MWWRRILALWKDSKSSDAIILPQNLLAKVSRTFLTAFAKGSKQQKF